MIVGLGIELVDLGRFEKLLERYGDRMRAKLFTASEREYAARKARDGESLASPVTLFDGPAVPGNGELEIRDQTWILEESPDALPVGSVLAYSLDLTLTDGGQIRLERLAGPAARPEALWPELLPPHPNPFNPQTEVTFRVPVGRDCVCRIVDMRGWHVATLYSGAATGQWQTVHWAGQADDGRTVPAGIYLVQLISGDLSQSRRIVLAK